MKEMTTEELLIEIEEIQKKVLEKYTNGGNK